MRIAIVVVAIVIFKLWLTSYIRTVPLYAPHDALNFVAHAHAILAGAWFGHYGSLTLIKGPVFPLYLAAISELGVSVNLAHQLTYLFACGIACIAIAPLLRNDKALVVIGLVLAFNPMTYDSVAWVTYRSHISGSLSLLTVACLIALYVRRTRSTRARLRWSIGLGFSLAALWLTREEGVWIVPSLGIIGGAAVLYSWRNPQSESHAPIVIIPCAIWALSIATIQTINGAVYGWPVSTEFQSEEFLSAYSSLERISHPTGDRTVPVPKFSREAAYRVSPLARQLEPFIDGAQAERGWFIAGCQAGYGCTDIAGGWFEWAFRGAVDLAGYYTTGPNARAYYVGLAGEIDRACDRGEIACDPKRNSYVPRLSGQGALIGQHAFLGIRRFAQFSGFGIETWGILASPPYVVREYAFVTHDVNPIGDAYANYDEPLKRGILQAVEHGYAAILPIALVMTLLLVTFRLVLFAMRRSRLDDAVVLALGVLASGAALLSILAIIDTLSFPGFTDEYFTALYSVVFYAVAVLFTSESLTLRKRMSRPAY